MRNTLILCVKTQNNVAAVMMPKKEEPVCWFHINLPKGCRNGDSCLDIHNPKKTNDEPKDHDGVETLDEKVDNEERRRRSTRPTSKEETNSKPKPKYQLRPRPRRSRSRQGRRDSSNDRRWVEYG